jgi:cation transporter-like permease
MESVHSELPSAQRRPDGLFSLSFVAPSTSGSYQPEPNNGVSLLRLNLLSEHRPIPWITQTVSPTSIVYNERMQLTHPISVARLTNYASIVPQSLPVVSHSALSPIPSPPGSFPLPNVVSNASFDQFMTTKLPITNSGVILPNLDPSSFRSLVPNNFNSFQSPPPIPPQSPSPDHSNGTSHDDSTRSAVKELLLPVLLSGFGNMGAGIILDRAQTWAVFRHIPQLIVLVPALLGLKGNVEMTLSSRLATHANLGQLADKSIRRDIVLGNVSLAQCQASAIGLLAPLIAIVFTLFHSDSSSSKTSLTNDALYNGNASRFDWNGTIPIAGTAGMWTSTVTPLTLTNLSATSLVDSHDNSYTEHQLEVLKVLLVMASSVLTSGLADLMLSSLMCGIVILCSNHWKINADNIATPIAASVGDLATMSLLAITSRTLYSLSSAYPLLPVVPIVIWLFIIMISGRIASQNRFTSKLVYTGWTPLLAAMLLQNTSGSVMERFFRTFPRMAAFQPVINGFGGNLVAVQSSRIATYLHCTCKKRQLPSEQPTWLVMPWTVFFGKSTFAISESNKKIILFTIN